MQILGEGLQRLASGDLTAVIHKPFESGLDRLRLDFNASQAPLARVVHTNVSVTTSEHAEMGRARLTRRDLSRRTENQAAALEETLTRHSSPDGRQDPQRLADRRNRRGVRRATIRFPSGVGHRRLWSASKMPREFRKSSTSLMRSPSRPIFWL